MKKTKGGSANRTYRVLLKTYPPAFRAKYGEEMEEVFLHLLEREGRQRGLAGRVDAWLSGGWDAISEGIRMRLRKETWDGHTPPSPFPSNGVGEMFGTLLRDVRLTVRGLLRKPLFALTVILSLAIGIGANASVFTLVDGLLLKPLPYEDAEELVALAEENTVRGWSGVGVSPLNARDWEERSHTLEGVGTYYAQDQTLTGEGPPALLTAVRVSSNMFDILGRAPVLGRGFSDDEMGVDRDNVVVLTNGFWQRQFGGARSVLGKSVELQGKARFVVGILPAGFQFLDQEPDLFLPLDLVPTDVARDQHFLKAIGRLANGSSLDEARTELDEISLQLGAEYPESNEGWKVQLSSLRADMLGPTSKSAALALMVAVGFVLLMVCVNVANLAMARGEHRTRELAVRTALGAGRGRIMLQLLSESLVLAFLGGGLGLLLASWGYRGVVATLPNYTSPNFQFGLNGSVVAFTLVTTLLSALLFGTVPAIRFSRSSVGALRDGGRGGLSTTASRFGSALVVLQTALALVLLVGGGVLMKRIAEMRGQDLGFNPENTVTVRVSPPAADYPGSDDITAFWRAVEGSVAQAPGVVSVGSTQSHPLMGATWIQTVRVAGQDQDRSTHLTRASGGLFDALGFRTVAGRPLRAEDDDDSSWTAVVNEAFVRAYLGPEADPLAVTLVNPSDSMPPMPVVGVIQDVVESNIDEPPAPALYLSFAQAPVRRRSLVVRTSGTVGEALPAIRAAVWSVDPKVPLDQVQTLRSLVDQEVGGFAVVANLMAVFAILSLFLGALGIYGVTAYAAGRRTNEIGIRMALGAEKGDVVRMVVSQGGRRAGLGLVLGLVAAYFLTRGVASLFVGIEAFDPTVFIVVTLILALVSFLALWIPAWRASAVGPMAALDNE